MGEPSLGNDRRARLMLAGLAFNTLLSLTAIGLWIASPGRGAPARWSSSAAVRPVSSVPPSWAPPPGPPRRAPLPANPPQPHKDTNAGDEPAATPLAALPPPRFDRPVSTSVAVVAERVNLNPQVLADQLADSKGDLPATSAKRLERAFDAATALAVSLGLDEARSQSLVALVTYYAFSALREEKAASPGGVDPAKMEELRSSTLADIKASCGDEAAAEAGRELAGL